MDKARLEEIKGFLLAETYSVKSWYEAISDLVEALEAETARFDELLKDYQALDNEARELKTRAEALERALLSDDAYIPQYCLNFDRAEAVDDYPHLARGDELDNAWFACCDCKNFDVDVGHCYNWQFDQKRFEEGDK